MKGVRPSLPGAPGLDALGLNVRTYVHLRGREPAIYAFSLDTDSALIAAGGRAGLGLPYHLARLSAHASTGSLAYSLDHRLGRPRARARLRVTAGPPLGPAHPDSLEHFLVNRFFIHSPRAGGLLATVQIHHPPFVLSAGGVDELAEDV